MSALLPCPHCGRRPAAEFRYGGEAGRPRPDAGDALDSAALADWLYGADNPRGPAPEWWHHAAGCRAWFVLVRDTGTDAIAGGPP